MLKILVALDYIGARCSGRNYIIIKQLSPNNNNCKFMQFVLMSPSRIHAETRSK